MNKIERLLNKEKEKLDKLEIPNNLEEQLRLSLENRPGKRKKNIRIKVASLILAIILLGYNLDTLAFYGKRLIGYENVMNGTLKELNELGKGQIIDKSYTFKNGVKINLDWIMLDDNNMVLFYTLESLKGNVQDEYHNMQSIEIVGFGNRWVGYSGAGDINEDGTKMNWVITTQESPRIFEKNFKFKINYLYENGEIESGEIPFKIDRSQAVGKSLKININKSIDLDNRNISFKSLVASPTSTVIKGKVQNILQLGLDTINKNRIRPEDINLRLIADGKEIDYLGSGITTNNKGITFDVRFDTLPSNTKDLQLELLSFSGDFDTDEKIHLATGDTKNIKVLEQDIRINNVYEKDGKTYINITTEENTQLSKVDLEVGGKKVGLEQTIPGEYTKESRDGDVNIFYTRTLEFNVIGESLTLNIQGIRYTKDYNKLIYKSTLK